jgi:hypothetical protein
LNLKCLIPLALILLVCGSLTAQEDPELEAYNASIARHRESGIELFLYYPMGIHLPGWSYESSMHAFGPVSVRLPGTNYSFFGLGGGVEFDLGSRKPVLDNMGVGAALELSALSDINMNDRVGGDMGLLLSYAYLFYRTNGDTGLNYSFRAGLGAARAFGAKALYDYPEERDDTAGPMYTLEAAVDFPKLWNFHFQAGLGYRILMINTDTIHLFSPMLRAGYRF